MDELVDYYTNRYREDERLDARPMARLEWLRTMELLAERIPPRSRILDVGGGPGRYARALTDAGHSVRLLDIVPGHVAAARSGQPPVEAEVADARSLPEPDAGYDVTLLLGPLYHLPHRDDRVAALAEAVRVTGPGGVVAVAAISRFAGPLDFASAGRLDEPWLEASQRLITDGVHQPSLGFTEAYFHRAEELAEECAAAGLPGVTVHGLEGPAWPAAEAARDHPGADAVFDGALRLARVYSSEPALVAASAHLLAIGTVVHSGRMGTAGRYTSPSRGVDQ